MLEEVSGLATGLLDSIGALEGVLGHQSSGLVDEAKRLNKLHVFNVLQSRDEDAIDSRLQHVILAEV